MCCFSVPEQAGRFGRLFFRRPRVHVGATKIFARTEGATEHLVYSLALSTPSDVAMVLPLPVAPNLGEAALRFVDFSDYDEFFEHLLRLFAAPQVAAASVSRHGQFSMPKLVVHDVGSFEASFVPTLADFDRLDERFRLPSEVWERLPEYTSFGFAVFKLKKARRKKIHPMAMTFTTNEPSTLFFPTVHVHDGKVHERAKFAHDLYFQVPAGVEPELAPPGGEQGGHHGASFEQAKCAVTIDKTHGMVDPEAPVWQWSLWADLPNADTRVKLGPRALERAA
jgi:hypothetical protein